MTIRKTLAVSLLLGASYAVNADDSFVVGDIRLEGLQRVALGAALTHVPFGVGDTVTDYTLSKSIKSLYSSGHFDQIRVERDGNIVTFRLIERPTISDIEFDGNKDIKDEQLQESMDDNGIRIGEPLDKTVISSIENGLTDFFHSVGKYTAKVEVVTTYLPRNRVKVKVNFEEGDAASVRQINIVGNSVYTDEELIGTFETQQNLPWWKFMASDRYQKQTLQGDMEKLRSYYLDRGYLKFSIDSTQISVTPEKDAVYVTFNVEEGETYTISDFEFVGDLLGREDFLTTIVPLKSGELYNGALVTHTEDMIARYLAQYGYANAEVKTLPDIDDENKTVKLILSVDPGKRVYVGRIFFEGNTTTKDEVLRRELRQLEGAFLSNDLLELSKSRIQRLTYIENVDYEVVKLPGSDDLVDVKVTVKEQPSGSFNAGVSYGSFTRLAFNIGITQNNFLGTGDIVGLNINTFSGSQSYSVNYTDPYFTIDGVSLGGNAFFSKFDSSVQGLERYRNESYGIGTTLGFPIDEFNRLQFGLAYKVNGITQLSEYEQIKNFRQIFQDPQDPDGRLEFANWEVTAGWARSTLNRGTFPTDGSSQGASLKITTPFSDTTYFKLGYNARFYFPLSNDHKWSFMTKLELGYGNGYGDKDGYAHLLPFWENFSAGGRKMRGFENNIIGPRAVYRTPTYINGIPDEAGNVPRIPLGPDFDRLSVSTRAAGGNAIAITTFELIFPLPFVPDDFANSFRTSFFLDVGNVWDTEFTLDGYSESQLEGVVGLEDFSDAGRYRASAGISFQWLSPMGPMTFSFARPLKKQEGDRTEFFTFNVGTTF